MGSEVRVSAAVRNKYLDFIASCRTPDGLFRLTPRAEPTPYALCFGIFGLQLLQARDQLEAHRSQWDRALREGLAAQAAARSRVACLERDKPYLQLLTFTLSALAILGTLKADPLAEAVRALLPASVEQALRSAGALEGQARSGNHAMFLGILLLHARDHLGMGTQPDIDRWVALHLQRMNRCGFWGNAGSMTHLQFQNGYHQYELFEYLGVGGEWWRTAAHHVASLADAEGHFAPYPGGGGCYDYDAVFVLSAHEPLRYSQLLGRTFHSIVAEQNTDGGFCESRRVRPRSVDNLARFARHIGAGRGRARWERLRQGLTLMRPRHDRMATHWSRYSRGWQESDLWDSWFRVLSLARIESAFDPAGAQRWGFIDYPGIGFHPSVRAAAAHA